MSFDSTLITFDSDVITFDQTSSQEAQVEQPAVGGRKRRERFIVRHQGRQTIVESVQELQHLIDGLKAEQPKKRNKKRPVAQVVVPQEVQAELYRHDLPNLAPMVKAFDFEALQAVMNRLEMIQQAIEEEDIEMLVLH